MVGGSPLSAMSRVAWYVLATSIAALSAALIVFAMAPLVTQGQVEAVSWLSLLGLISLLQVYTLPGGGSGSIAFIPWLATALISPNWLTVVGVCTANLIAEAFAKRTPIKAVFNISQFCLATSLSIVAYRVVGGVPLLESASTPLFDVGRSTILPLSLLIAAFFISNSLSVAGVIAIQDRRSVLRIWKQNTNGTIAYDILSAPIVFLFGWLFVRTGPLGAAGLAIPLLGARQLYKTNRQLEQVNEELLQLMVKAIEARDPYTSGHSRRVSHYSRIIARAIGLSSKQIERVGVAALLHDVGKIHEIYAPILRKPGKLTPDEWAIMQTHPVKSAELVATVSGLKDIVGAVRSHHESWDGSGYPDALAGEQIPLGARIIKFADTIDAMTSDRPYRAAMTEREVRSELEKFKGIQFDPEICDRLLLSPAFQLLFAADRPDSGSFAVRAMPESSNRHLATA